MSAYWRLESVAFKQATPLPSRSALQSLARRLDARTSTTIRSPVPFFRPVDKLLTANSGSRARLVEKRGEGNEIVSEPRPPRSELKPRVGGRRERNRDRPHARHVVRAAAEMERQSPSAAAAFPTPIARFRFGALSTHRPQAGFRRLRR